MTWLPIIIWAALIALAVLGFWLFDKRNARRQRRKRQPTCFGLYPAGDCNDCPPTLKIECKGKTKGAK